MRGGLGLQTLGRVRGDLQRQALYPPRFSLGDFVAMHLYEDLYKVAKSRLLTKRIEAQERVLNVQNRRRGIEARRGDGTFGELVPGFTPIQDPGFKVATVEIGIEVKILAKAMIKQIDRVIGDLRKQVEQFPRGASRPRRPPGRDACTVCRRSGRRGRLRSSWSSGHD